MAGLRKEYKLNEICATPKEFNSKKVELTRYIHFKDGYAYAFNLYACVKAKLKDIMTFVDDNEMTLLDGKSVLAEKFKILLGNWFTIENGMITYKKETGEESLIELLDTESLEENTYTLTTITRIFDSVKDGEETDKIITSVGFSLKMLERINKSIGADNNILFSFYKKASIIGIMKVKDYRNDNFDIMAVCIPSRGLTYKEQ